MSESFVCELPLATTPEQDRALSVRLEAARQVYNVCLGESLRLLALMRESRDWQKARQMPKGKDRTSLYRAVIERFDFRQSAIDRVAIACKNGCWIGDHIGPHEAQAVGKRAFQAVRQYALGKRGRPRFKGRRGLRSVEAKTNAAGIRWRGGRIEWAGLSIPAMFDPKDRHGWQADALSNETKYCRIVRRVVNGRDRWCVQLVQEGVSPWKAKNEIGEGETGLDLGPSAIAVVGENDALLKRFCPTVEQPWKEIRRIQRAMDRSRRATNPDNYNPDGTVKKGVRIWLKSSHYEKHAVRVADVERRLAAERKRSHGELGNQVIRFGKIVNSEKISYRSFQRAFGKSVKVRGPGMFVSTMRRKAERAGGALVEFSTATTLLSQVCHGCGSAKKKPLSLRIHACECGVGPVQRDLYSAFLARFVHEDRLDARQAELAWPGAEPLLRRAASSLAQPASGGGIATVHADPRRQSGSPAEGERSRQRERARRTGPAGTGRGATSRRVSSPEPPGFSHGRFRRYPVRSTGGRTAGGP